MRVNKAACRESRALGTSGAAGTEPRLVSNKGRRVRPARPVPAEAPLPQPRRPLSFVSAQTSHLLVRTLAKG